QDAFLRDSVYDAAHYAGCFTKNSNGECIGADVVNISLGCAASKGSQDTCNCGVYNLSDDKYSALTEMLDRELADMHFGLLNSVIAIAAGNCAQNLDGDGFYWWPAAMAGNNVLRVASVSTFPNSIAGATQTDPDLLSTFSNYGEHHADLAAPGEVFVLLLS